MRRPFESKALRDAANQAIQDRAFVLDALSDFGLTTKPAQFDVEIPIPPSMNNAYFNLAKGKGRAKTSDYKAWKNNTAKEIQMRVPAALRIGGPVSVSILLPSKMPGDVDNRIKGVLDALVASGRIDDDRNVVKEIGRAHV